MIIFTCYLDLFRPNLTLSRIVKRIVCPMPILPISVRVNIE